MGVDVVWPFESSAQVYMVWMCLLMTIVVSFVSCVEP